MWLKSRCGDKYGSVDVIYVREQGRSYYTYI